MNAMVAKSLNACFISMCPLLLCGREPLTFPTYWSLLIQPVRAAPGRGVEPQRVYQDRAAYILFPICYPL